MPQTEEHLAILEQLDVRAGNSHDHEVGPGGQRVAAAGHLEVYRATGHAPRWLSSPRWRCRPGPEPEWMPCASGSRPAPAVGSRPLPGDGFRMPIDRVLPSRASGPSLPVRPGRASQPGRAGGSACPPVRGAGCAPWRATGGRRSGVSPAPEPLSGWPESSGARDPGRGAGDRGAALDRLRRPWMWRSCSARRSAPLELAHPGSPAPGHR